MNEPAKEPRLLRFGRWLQEHKAMAAAIMLVVTLFGVVMGQTWLLALGSMGLWFVLYPGLIGSAWRHLPDRGSSAQPQMAGQGAWSATAAYTDQLQHALSVRQRIEDAASRVHDPSLRQSAQAAVGVLPELIKAIYGLSMLAENTRKTFAGAGSDKVRRWDAQIDHAVSLFDTLLYEMISAADGKSIGEKGSISAPEQNFTAWPGRLKREVEWLRAAAAEASSQLMM